ncbi:MAG: class I SAM-dependent methyltransferase [Gammaproteobacteria bacterium]|nr:class I SAM-dependent methyltransferase [Gammaproteobacteria bacterium]
MLEHFSEKLNLSPQGIWEPNADLEEISYPDDGHHSRVALEENSFWFNHRNTCIQQVVKKYPPNGVIFDIGGGNGYVSLGLQQIGIETVLVEPGATGARNAKQRGIKHVVCSSFQNAGFQSGSLPAIGVFDVVEHIEDDSGFLNSLSDKLTRNGRLYITAPAFNALWSAKDIHEGHFRRYTISKIKHTLLNCGFEIEYANYFFNFLVPPIFLLKALPFKLGLTNSHDTKKGQQEHKQAQGITKTILDFFSRHELNKIKNDNSIKFGSSVIVVAKQK